MTKALLLPIAAILLLVPFNGFLGSAWLAAALEVIPLILLCAWFWMTRFSNEPQPLAPGFPALLAVVAWGLFQLIPLPPSVVKILSPSTWRIYQQSVGVLVTSPWMPLSLYPKGTLQAVFTLCSGIACYHLASQLLQDRRSLKQAALWLTGISGCVAVVTTVLCIVKLSLASNLKGDSRLGVFLQNDLVSLGLLLLLLGPLALAVMLAARPSSRYGSLQERIASFWQATMQDHFLIVALSALFVPFSLAFLDWRYALFYIGAMGLLWGLLFVKKRGRREVPYLLLAMLLLAGALAIGVQSGSISKITSTILPTSTDRTIARDLAYQYALAGSGLGTYEKLYQRLDLKRAEPSITPDPHPFVMLTRTEAGWLSVAAAIWFFVALLRRTWPSWRKRRNKLALYLFAGSLSGLLFFTLAVVLLDLPIPIWLGYYVFVVAGLVVATSRSSYSPPVHDEYKPGNHDWRLSLRVLITAGLVLAALLFYGGGFLAEVLVRSSQVGDGQDAMSNLPERRLLSHAAFYDPLEASYRRDLAWKMLQEGRSNKAMSYFEGALRLDPLAGLEVYRLGIFMADAGYENVALKLMRHGLNNDWSNQVLQVDYVGRLLKKGDRNIALEHIRQILTVAPSMTLEWLHFLYREGLDVSKVAAILARDPRCHADYADFLLEKSRPDLAANSYATALNILQGADNFDPEIVWRLSAYFESQKEYEKALKTLLVGVRAHPDDLALLKASGRLHELMGLTYKATEIYRQVLILTPQDQELRQHLKRLAD
mgnify:CR=1 FL=1